jgi:hypothetical protein
LTSKLPSITNILGYENARKVWGDLQYSTRGHILGEKEP